MSDRTAPSPERTLRRSGLGLLIVVLLLVHLFVFGPATCPLRPTDARRLSAADTAAIVLSPSVPAPHLGAGAATAAPSR